MSPLHRILAAAALLAAMSPVAHALDLFTADSQATNGNIIRCVITNVGTKPVEVTSNILGQDGSNIGVSSSCVQIQAILDPGKVCETDSAIPGFKSGYCHFTTTSSKVRAALLVVSGNGGDVTSTLAATK